MDSNHTQKPHVVCVPAFAQGHINPFMQLAKLLHSNGFHITFVHAEFNYRRLAKSLGPDFVNGLPDFQFEAMSDNLPPSEKEANQDNMALVDSIMNKCFEPFKGLVGKLNSSSPEVPPISCIISDAAMSFPTKVADELGIPRVQFWTASACGFLGYLQFDELVRRGIIPFKDENFAVDGTLDMTLDWVPGMKDIKLKDLPSFCRVTSLDDIMFRFTGSEAQNCIKSSSIIINTFQELESEVLDAIKAKNPNVYNIGPVHMLSRHLINEKEKDSRSIGSSLWKTDSECFQWLEKWEPNSVIYVSFGSMTVMTEQRLMEFAWGLANSKHPFLWIMRPDLVKGESETSKLPQEFLDEIKDRGYITSWCSQEEVLAHPSVGFFLTHCGWNSTMESMCHGVPLFCWPCFSEQPTNSWLACTNLGIGMEVKPDVKREEIAALVKEAMEGDKGKEMRQRALEWKKKAMKATDVGGSSYKDFKRLIKDKALG